MFRTVGPLHNVIQHCAAGVAHLESCVGFNVTGFDCSASISQNRSIPLSYPGREVFLSWENPGKAVGPNNSYVTATSAGAPEFVIWVSQLNITYSPLTNISSSNGMNFGQTIQPDVSTYEGDPAINGEFLSFFLFFWKRLDN